MQDRSVGRRVRGEGKERKVDVEIPRPSKPGEEGKGREAQLSYVPSAQTSAVGTVFFYCHHISISSYTYIYRNIRRSIYDSDV
jgi:hypothetical protein